MPNASATAASTKPWFARACPAPSQVHASEARSRQAQLTKPPGALGALEAIAIDLAGLQATARPGAERVAILVLAADHGVTAQGVSAFPSSVTVEMLRNFAAGGAAISVLARAIGATLAVVDAGALEHPPIAGVVVDKPRCGTRDFSIEPALTAAEVEFALGAGRRSVARVLDAAPRPDILILGEMGIGNTTAAAAIAAALLGRDPATITGAGTGLDRAGIAAKTAVIAGALARHGLAPGTLHATSRARPAVSPLDVLAKVGGLEITALTGAMIAAAHARLPVLVDGFIVTVAALVAVRLAPSCRPWLLFSHASAEQGHRLVLEALEARPLLDLALRLGEGTGAAVALPILRLACALHNGMATFAEAGVSQRADTHVTDAHPADSHRAGPRRADVP